MKRLWFYLTLPLLGLYLLAISCFEDTNAWAEDKLMLMKQTFAVVMLLLAMAIILFCSKALSQNGSEFRQMEKRVDRIETRQDYVLQENKQLSERVAMLEMQARNIDRLIYGVVALALADLGQWGLALFRTKMGKQL